jgi:hypothetical protein
MDEVKSRPLAFTAPSEVVASGGLAEPQLARSASDNVELERIAMTTEFELKGELNQPWVVGNGE